MIKSSSTKNFELFTQMHSSEQLGQRVAKISLQLGRVAMDFSRVERVPRYADSERESDVEHSYMLGLIAPELAVALEFDLDQGLLAQFANVHDLIELKTGDVATFLLTSDQLLQKELVEQAAIRELMAELPPYTAQLLERYESQIEPEARFVRLVDKLLPLIVDIIGDGQRVMHEDYDVTTSEQLKAAHTLLHARIRKQFGEEFPDVTLAHRILCELFEVAFSEQVSL